MALKAVAFDVDGTLYPSHALFRQAWTIAARNARLAAAFGRVRAELRTAARLEEYARGGKADLAALRAFQADLTARLLGWPAEKTAALIQEILYDAVAERFDRIRPFPGLVPALDALRDANLRLAAMSDFPPARKLELMGLSDRFAPALCSEDSGFLKPRAEPFLMLARRLALEPREILYVGNSPACDVRGAKAVGMLAALVSRGTNAEADLVFHDWRDLVAFALRKLGGIHSNQKASTTALPSTSLSEASS